MKDKIIIYQLEDPYDSEAVDTSQRNINLSQIDNIEFEDIDHNDHPDFCDAYISSADMNGEAMSEEELNDLNENYGDFVHEKLFEHLY